MRERQREKKEKQRRRDGERKSEIQRGKEGEGSEDLDGKEGGWGEINRERRETEKGGDEGREGAGRKARTETKGRLTCQYPHIPGGGTQILEGTPLSGPLAWGRVGRVTRDNKYSHCPRELSFFSDWKGLWLWGFSGSLILPLPAFSSGRKTQHDLVLLHEARTCP